MALSGPITAETMASISAEVVNTYKDIDGAAGNQCWDSVNYINEHYFGLPRINTGGPGRWPGWAGNMVDSFPQTPEVDAAFVLLPPESPGLPGDTYVWGDSYPVWYPETHTATLLWDLGNGWGQFLSQNSSAAAPWLGGYSTDSTGPIIEQTLPLQGLIGIIRPRTDGGIAPASISAPAPASQEDELSQQEVLQIQGFTNSVTDQVWGTAAGTQKLLQDLFSELGKKLENADYQMRLFNQASDNFTGDRIINTLRDQIGVIAASVAASAAAQGKAEPDIKQAVTDALSGATFNFTGTVTTADPAAAAPAPAPAPAQ